MKTAIVLIYIGGHHGHAKLSPWERKWAWVAVLTAFAVAIFGALWVYRSWKNDQKRKRS